MKAVIAHIYEYCLNIAVSSVLSHGALIFVGKIAYALILQFTYVYSTFIIAMETAVLI